MQTLNFQYQSWSAVPDRTAVPEPYVAPVGLNDGDAFLPLQEEIAFAEELIESGSDAYFGGEAGTEAGGLLKIADLDRGGAGDR